MADDVRAARVFVTPATARRIEHAEAEVTRSVIASARHARTRSGDRSKAVRLACLSMTASRC
ncbi:MAG TPA: hypothetical protein VHT91_32225 [Kofleriaceae bacterium]|jgi:hypothetical protein|nr:hypothetical protein [Kofleriaceae bacterium]